MDDANKDQLPPSARMDTKVLGPNSPKVLIDQGNTVRISFLPGRGLACSVVQKRYERHHPECSQFNSLCNLINKLRERGPSFSLARWMCVAAGPMHRGADMCNAQSTASILVHRVSVREAKGVREGGIGC